MGAVIGSGGTVVPFGHPLNESESKRCVVLRRENLSAWISFYKSFNQDLSSFFLHAEDVYFLLQEDDEDETDGQLMVRRQLRQCVLLHGVAMLSHERSLVAGCSAACLPSSADAALVPNHWHVAIRSLRSIGGQQENGVVALGYADQQNDPYKVINCYYQTAEPERSLNILMANVVANYCGYPTWAVPIRWEIDVPLHAVSDQALESAAGEDGGFSTAFAGCMAARCARDQETPICRPLTASQVTDLIQKQLQPPSEAPPQLQRPDYIPLVELARKCIAAKPIPAPKKRNVVVTTSANPTAVLVVDAIDCLPFNTFYRTLAILGLNIQRDVVLREALCIRLCRVLMYNVTLRELDLSGTNLSGFGQELGQALAMNIQPLITRLNLSRCKLTEADVRGLHPGIARLWCGGSAVPEVLSLSGNPSGSDEAWQLWWHTLADPSTSSLQWPAGTPPPPPNLGFLQKLDVSKTPGIVGHGLNAAIERMVGLQYLCMSGHDDYVERFLQSLAYSQAPLKTFHGHEMDGTFALSNALFSHVATLENVVLDSLRGDDAPFLGGWPQSTKKKFKLDLVGSTRVEDSSTPTTADGGFSPSKLVIDGQSPTTINQRRLDCLYTNGARGLRALYLTDVLFHDLDSVAPVLAACGLETLHAVLRSDNRIPMDFERCSNVWIALARSKTLFEINVSNQLKDRSNPLEFVGLFLKTNRSVRVLIFDSAGYTLTINGVKSLRSAFYGNRKVTSLEYPSASKQRAVMDLRRVNNECLDEVRRSKAQIKRLFKQAYSKYNHRWRDRPNQQKGPFVERIRVAKRRMGKANRDMKKMGVLLEEVSVVVTKNSMEYSRDAASKTHTKLTRKQSQLERIAQKKKKVVTKVVKKLQKAKLKGRNGKSAKKQVSRASYYSDEGLWPHHEGNIQNSRWNSMNDPYSIRGVGFVSIPAVRTSTDTVIEPEIEVTSSPTNNREATVMPGHAGVPSFALALHEAAPVRRRQRTVWSGLGVNRRTVSHYYPADPWDGVDIALVQLDLLWRRWRSFHYFHYFLHDQCSELGPDVVSEIAQIGDESAKIEESMDDVADATGADVTEIERIVNSKVAADDEFDCQELSASLYDVPDYVDEEADDGADSVVEMYAGAGPRDLDDGPSPASGGNAALSGARRRASIKKWNRLSQKIRRSVCEKGCIGYKTLAFPLGGSDSGTESVNFEWSEHMQEWNEIASNVGIDAMADSDLFPFPDCSADEPALMSEWKEFHPSSGFDVCLVTQCSLDRFQNLMRLLLAWGGSASVAVYVRESEDIDEAVKTIQGLVQSSHTAQINNVAFRVVRGSNDDEPYPINYLRNVALLEAQRQQRKCGIFPDNAAVFLVDVDFVPSRNLHTVLHCREAHTTIMKQNHVAVIPAFECLDSVDIPRSISDLHRCVSEEEAEGFHLSHFPAGHGPTNFTSFWSASLATGDICPSASTLWKVAYTVDYEPSFEPYVIMATSSVPLYDERFTGYGLNKVAHLAQVAHKISTSFLVVPGAFIVAPIHQRSDSWHSIYGSTTDDTEFSKLWLKGLYRNFLRRLNVNATAAVSPRTLAMRNCLSEATENTVCNEASQAVAVRHTAMGWQEERISGIELLLYRAACELHWKDHSLLMLLESGLLSSFLRLEREKIYSKSVGLVGGEDSQTPRCLKALQQHESNDLCRINTLLRSYISAGATTT